MRQVAKKGLITIAAAGGVLAVTGGYAYADTGASGGAAHSPGIGSGNVVQAPIGIPVNVCGNTATVLGVLNGTGGSGCGNVVRGGGAGGSQHTGSSAESRTENSPGIGSGNDVQVPVHVPVNACGNGVAVGTVGNTDMGGECGGVVEAVPNDPSDPGDPGDPSDPGDPGQPGDPGDPGDPGKPDEPGKPGKPHNPGDNKPGGHTPVPSSPGHNGGDGAGRGGQQGAQQIGAHGAHLGGSQLTGSEQLAHTGAGPVELAIPAAAGALLAGTVLYRRARARQH